MRALIKPYTAFYVGQPGLAGDYKIASKLIKMEYAQQSLSSVYFSQASNVL